ncbi:deoxynucleoside kinase [Aestuariicella hydrocarbonica]|uniref:Deoxynucleoside kinase n=1 Tax=Pseudomaricurvus hydrocarbonicus TaxID=1470433 RepID=A0A9E5JVT5_9GAMM|nr:deoxynucleoside kinase [Aestuariicella hydrocarbonica]
MSEGFNITIDTKGIELPRFVAIEGPIGVGKTTLARHLAKTLGYDLLEEQADANPFLERFYDNPKAAALPTQLFFLFQRSQQIQDLRQQDMFQGAFVADFLMDKDQLFAQVTLDDDELNIYQQVYDQLAINAPEPDLVIYLQAPNHVLEERIRSRGNDAERNIESGYLQTLNDAYMHFFHYYDRAPLLIVNAAELDLANNPNHYQQLVEYMLTVKSGRHYYNPTPTL